MREGGTEGLKREAAARAAEWICDGMKLGLGTGSTVRFLLEEISRRRRAGEWRDVVGVPTSEDTRVRAEGLGIPLGTLADHPELDLTIDGADEVDPELRLIKGMGGALLREKVVATASATVVIIVDATKLVERLGTRSPLPVEVDPFSAPIQEPFFRSLGGEPVLRRRPGGEPAVTDGGNRVFDVRFVEGIRDATALEVQLNNRPGVLENGLFLGIADHVVVAGEGGSRVLSRAKGGH